MRIHARNSSAKDATTIKSRSRAKQTLLSQTATTTVSRTGYTFLQQKPLCPCDGGCPRCVAEIQPKLRIGRPNDKYEQEADRIADEVMCMPESNVQRKAGCSSCCDMDEEEQIQPKPIGDQITPIIQRQEETGIEGEEDEEEPVQLKAMPDKSPHVTTGLQSQMQSMRGGGQSLSASTRTFFEQRFGRDLSNVRVHTDSKAAGLASSLNAKAFTKGNDIVFGSNQYLSDSKEGQKLLAHELTHVVQQRGWRGGNYIQRRLRVMQPARPATYLPPPDNRRPRGELVERWLRQLCPTGTWSVSRSTGEVRLGNRQSLCSSQSALLSSGTPVSCECLCRVTAANYEQIDIVIQDRFTYDRFRLDRNLGIFVLETEREQLRREGEGMVVYPEEGAWLDNKTVVLSGRSTTVRGAGDTTRGRGSRVVRDPPWIILGHEICGHVETRRRGTSEYHHLETPTGSLSAVDIENRIRREHSTLRRSFGIRSGETGGVYGSLYVISSGETYLSICRRVGLGTGPRVWDRDGYHRYILHWPSGDRIQRSDISTLIRAGNELVIQGIHWHEVITGETWRSIAAMRRVTPVALRRANPGISSLNVGMRLLIPVR